MSSHVRELVRQLRMLNVDAGELRDGQLLEEFLRDNSEAAFAALVGRHGALVLGVSRRVLRNAQDAEDVFQATFLVLARKAQSIRKTASLASWLYGVAFRLAMKMKSTNDRRRVRERSSARVSGETTPAVELEELTTILDEELRRVPERQRQPLLLCDLEGLTQEEAARQLGWPRGTLKRRLEAGRQRLRDRLIGRGVAVGATLAGLLSESTAGAAVPVGVRLATVQAAVRWGAGKRLPAGLVSEKVLHMVRGVLGAMVAYKICLSCIVALGLALSASGAWLLAKRLNDPPGNASPAVATANPQADGADRRLQPAGDAPKTPNDNKQAGKQPLKGDLAKFQGTWDLISMETLGSPITADKLAPTWVRFKGKSYEYMQAEGTNFQTHFKGDFKLNEAARPKQVDINYTERTSKAGLPVEGAKVEVGIYERQGDMLKMCLGIPKDSEFGAGLPNAGRPKEFTSMPGTGAYILVLKRRKDMNGKTEAEQKEVDNNPIGDGKDKPATGEKEPLKFSVNLPKAQPTLADVNSGAYRFKVLLQNTGKKDLTVWPFLKFSLLDDDGKPLKPTTRIGRWGVVKSSPLEEIQFKPLKPGQKYEIEVSLAKYFYDPDAIVGYRLPASGKYKLAFNYRFDAAEAKTRYGVKAKDPDNPGQPWNRAYQTEQTFNVELKVAE